MPRSISPLALVALAIAGCGGSPRPHSITLQAPTTAERWSSATVVTHYSQLDVHNSLIGGTTTHDESDVELVVRHANGEGRTITLVKSVNDAFGIARSPRALATLQFQLRSSPDGAWIVISADDGASWLLVDPDALVVCRHLGLRGRPETFWNKLPAPRALDLDLLAVATGAAGSLGIDHGNDELELRLARDWIVTQGDRAELAPLLAATVLSGADNESVDRAGIEAIRARLADPQIVAQVRAVFERVRDGHLHTAVVATELLWDARDVPLQALLATWIARAAAPGGPKIYEYAAVAGGEWSFAHSVWNLARLVRRDGAVTPEAEAAAIAVISHAAKQLPSADDRAQARRQGTLRVWGMMHSAPQAAATYAIQILIAARTPAARTAIESADFDRTATPRAPKAALVDPLKDYQVSDIGHDLGAVGDVDGVLAYAVAQLADVR